MAEQAPNSVVGEIDIVTTSSVAYDDETIIWQGGPSQWVNLGTYLWWTVFLLAVVVLYGYWYDSMSEQYSDKINTIVGSACLGVAAAALLSITHAFFSVRYEHTVITRNKIKEAKGITRIFRRELYCELGDVTDIKSPAAGLLGVFGLSTLVMETQDDDQPIIRLRAIRDREKLIADLLPIWRNVRMDRKAYFGG